MNIIITGDAGIGKTYVANIIAKVFLLIGILATDKFEVITAGNLIAGFIGQTALKTLKVLRNSLEGVLFIDEAYQLTPCKGEESKNSFNSESITEIINFIDKNQGLNIIIAAGYEKKMKDCFMEYNEGMKRRFPTVIALTKYDNNDLFNIFESEYRKKLGGKFPLSNDDKDLIFSIITLLLKNYPMSFNNMAGDINNLVSLAFIDRILIEQKVDRQIIIDSFRQYLSTKEIYMEIS